MGIKQLHLILLMLLVAAISSCKKSSSQNNTHKVNPGNIDTQKIIQGLWKNVSNGGYYTLGLTSDGIFNEDISQISEAADITKYQVNHDTLKIVNGSTGLLENYAVITKLDADSLVIRLFPAGFTIHNFRYFPPVSPYSIITLAGTGTRSGGIINGDGGPALSALLTPASAAEDKNGNIYIADPTAYEIRILTPDKNINKFISGDSASPHYIPGFYQPAAVYIYPGDDNMYIATTTAIYKYSLTTNTYTMLANFIGTSAILQSICADKDGNVYFSDVASFSVYKLETVTNKITALAGPSTHLDMYPSQVVVDNAGHLFISDASSSKIYKLDISTGTITVFAGNGVGFSGDGGPATSAEMSRPDGVAVDAAGNVYISDLDNTRLRKVDLAGNISTIAGRPYGYVIDAADADESQITPAMLYVNAANQILVCDSKNLMLRKVFLP